VSASPSPPEPPDPLKSKQAHANLWKTRLEAAQILFIFLIGALAAGLFYLWQANEAHNHYYADLQAEREKADSALRAEMFKTLVSAYFRQVGEPSSGAAPGAKKRAPDEATSLAQIERDIMLSDLLSRNFDTVDVRPLFEDLDRRLGQQPTEGVSNPAMDPKDALALRERLRRVAAGATSRQRGQLNFPVTYAVVTSCPGKTVTVDALGALGEREVVANGAKAAGSDATDMLQGSWKDPAIAFRVVGVQDAEVFMEGLFGGTRASVPQFTVSYYDMPLLEQVRLPTNERVAFSVTKYVSTEICRSEALKRSRSMNDAREVVGFCKDLESGCERARLAITTFPEDYIAARDRPFLTELTKKQKGLLDLIGWSKSDTPTISTTSPR